MPTVTDLIRRHLLESVGFAESSRKLPDLDVLRETEWSAKFERLMRNRLIMGAFRYERMHEKHGRRYDILGSIRTRLATYERTGNLEHLVDVANLALIEFVAEYHPNAHWAAGDDPEHHTQRVDA